MEARWSRELLKFNEGKVCEAILRLLEAREGYARNDLTRPEAENHAYPVELTWKMGGTLYALEHTGIEPFEDHMRLDAEAQRHFGPIKDALANLLPRDVLEIHVPVKVMLHRGKAEIKSIQDAIIDWARREAPNLPAQKYADYRGGLRCDAVQGIPFPISLFRFENTIGAQEGVEFRHLVKDGGREQGRLDRLGRACDAKFPKLAWWNRNQGARTILILEENDIQLTNHEIVAASYLALALGRDDRPDETYLVSTCLPQWSIWPLLIGNETIDSLRIDGYARRWDIDPSGLTSATAR